MSIDQDYAPPGQPVGQGSGPIGLAGPVFPMYTPEFAEDPHRYYREMRIHNPDFARVELAPGVYATLVIGWRWAVRILHDPERFRADPTRWQDTISPECPLRPMMEARRNALRSDGFAHAYYRQATNAALSVVDLHKLHSVVAEHATYFIDEVAPRGRMDLVADFAGPLATRTFNTIMGCPPALGIKIARGFAMMFDADADPRAVNAMIDGALGALIALKRAQPGDDIPTALIRHAGDMDDHELREQILTMYAAAIEPLLHLVVNTVLLTITDKPFGEEVISGLCTTDDALNQVLFRHSPLANLCVRYPVQETPLGLIVPAGQPVPVDGVTLPKDEPVVISMAACNTDPRITRSADADGDVDYSGNAAHLSFSAGPHTCPARVMATQFAADAVNELLDRLPDLGLGCAPDQLEWRPGPFHRALKTLPVVWAVRR